MTRVLACLVVCVPFVAWPCSEPAQQTVAVIGASADASRYAIRISTRIHEDESASRKTSLCSYPDSPELKSPDGVELAICTVDGPCTPAMPVYPVAAALDRMKETTIDRARCGTQALAEKNLAAAKASIAKAGISLDFKPTVLQAEKAQFGLPAQVRLAAGTLAAWGVNDPVLARIECPTDEAPPKLSVGTDGAAMSTVLTFPYASKCMTLDYAALTPAALVGVTKLIMAEMPLSTEARNKALFTAPWDVPLSRIASRVLNQRALDAHRAGKFDEAAKDFGAAFKADATFGQAAFNQACALAQAKDAAGAVAALKSALAIDRKVFSAKARRDPDLAALRKDRAVQRLIAEQ